MKALVEYAEKDQEPYEAGKIEGNMEEVKLEEHLDISIHACDEYGYILDGWFQNEFKGENGK
jgi:hypothetical protein